jgi:hypothetical protein
MLIPTDHKTLIEFVRALANASEYKSSDLGYKDSISSYWRDEALAWVAQFDAPLSEQKPVQTSGPACTNCGAFTTRTRVRSHGMCMRCEYEKKECKE